MENNQLKNAFNFGLTQGPSNPVINNEQEPIVLEKLEKRVDLLMETIDGYQSEIQIAKKGIHEIWEKIWVHRETLLEPEYHSETGFASYLTTRFKRDSKTAVDDTLIVSLTAKYGGKAFWQLPVSDRIHSARQIAYLEKNKLKDGLDKSVEIPKLLSRLPEIKSRSELTYAINQLKPKAQKKEAANKSGLPITTKMDSSKKTILITCKDDKLRKQLNQFLKNLDFEKFNKALEAVYSKS